MHKAELLAAHSLRSSRHLGRKLRVGGRRARSNDEGTHCKLYARLEARKCMPITMIRRRLHRALSSLEAYAAKDAGDIGLASVSLAETVTNNHLTDVTPSSFEH